MPLFESSAHRAGRQAGRIWRTIQQHTDDIENLTGKELYVHAVDQARDYLNSRFNIVPLSYPEREQHQAFLDYLDGFLSNFPVQHGYPKE